jgi:hypothetical protein
MLHCELIQAKKKPAEAGLLNWRLTSRKVFGKSLGINRDKQFRRVM